jgi:hypothetical protein
MFQLKNDTPFVAQIYVSPNPKGVDTLYVIVKETYDLIPTLRISENQQPIIAADQYRGELGKSSLKYASEIHPEKPGTDVAVIGEACAPGGKPVMELTVSVSVLSKSRSLKIFGNRRWKTGFWGTEPEYTGAFVRMPLIYEQAYGGTHIMDEASGTILTEKRNPVGKGFIGKRNEKEQDGVELPNIEDPRHLIKNPLDTPEPVGFGFIAPHWEPRVSFLGTYDEIWRKTRAPKLPENFDARFYSAAHPDLFFTPHLRGGEPVTLTNLSPRGRQTFNLPANEPKIEAKITGRFETLKANLETVLLEPTDERMSLLWRAAIRTGKRITGAKVEVAL